MTIDPPTTSATLNPSTSSSSVTPPGSINTGYQVDIYDIDLFDVEAEAITALHARGHRVICYFSAGSWEDWRSDAASFPSAALGKALEGWPDEKWLDVRSAGVRQVMTARLDLAVKKGCDGVEPDNVDAYQNSSGSRRNRMPSTSRPPSSRNTATVPLCWKCTASCSSEPPTVCLVTRGSSISQCRCATPSWI